MKNIFLLSTYDKSRLYFNNTPPFILRISKRPLNWKNARHLYITSENENISENDYIITKDGKLIEVSYLLSKDTEGGSKVVLTTDLTLIKNGVQDISDDFLQWFINNHYCKFIEVKKEYITPLGDIAETCYDNERLNYKIIIPQEEELKQDFNKDYNELEDSKLCEPLKSWEDSKRTFTEEEVLEIIESSCEHGMYIQRTINDKVNIPYHRIKYYQKEVLKKYKNK